MKYFVMLFVIALLPGCSTVKTAGVAENETVMVGDGRDPTRCDSIPRIYSGVAYEICALNRTPNIDAGNSPGTRLYLPVVFIANVVADTVILPWTVFRQFEAGNIPVK